MRSIEIAAVLVHLVAAGLVVPSAAAQGETGFLRGKGKVDATYSYAREEFDRFWVGSTKVGDPAVGEITRETGNLHVAWGVTDDLDLFANASYLDAENDGTTHFHDERAAQDGIAGLKWRFLEWRVGPGAFSLLAAPAVKLPLSHYEADSFTGIGDGQIDYRARAIAHWLFDFGGFISVESGFDYRTERPANEIPIHVTAGMTFFDRVTVAPFWSRIDSEDGVDIGQGPFPAVEEDVERWGIGVYARLDERYGLSLGWKDTIDGRNTGDLWGVWLGLVVRL